MPNEQTVFIVDDDKGVRDSLCALVGSHGLSSRSYSSAERFIASGDYTRPGCVIADVRMEGMSGLELRDELRSLGVQIPIIVITGYAEWPTDRLPSEGGDLTLLEKSCTGPELWDAIRKALESDAESTRPESN